MEVELLDALGGSRSHANAMSPSPDQPGPPASDQLRPHIGHPPAPAWVDRQWLAVAERLDRRPTWRWVWALAAAAVIALVAWRALDASPAVRIASGTVEAAAPETFGLRDGSRVELAGRLEVERDAEERVRLALHDGRGHFEVAKRPARTFEVDAHGVLVRVVGTTFDVTVSDEAEGRRVRVVVSEGIVEVTPPGAAALRLTAGERWTALYRTSEEPAPPTTAEAPAPSAEPAPSAAAEAPAPPPVTAKALFERAMTARRAGRFAEAAAAFEELLRRFPDDPRAGLAAMELGRLRADHLDDAEGAADAFERAEAGTGTLAEDALAGRIRSLDATGDVAACRAAASRYLATYPQGAHRAEVQASCRSEAKDKN